MRLVTTLKDATIALVHLRDKKKMCDLDIWSTVWEAIIRSMCSVSQLVHVHKSTFCQCTSWSLGKDFQNCKLYVALQASEKDACGYWVMFVL